MGPDPVVPLVLAEDEEDGRDASGADAAAGAAGLPGASFTAVEADLLLAADDLGSSGRMPSRESRPASVLRIFPSLLSVLLLLVEGPSLLPCSEDRTSGDLLDLVWRSKGQRAWNGRAALRSSPEQSIMTMLVCVALPVRSRGIPGAKCVIEDAKAVTWQVEEDPGQCIIQRVGSAPAVG